MKNGTKSIVFWTTSLFHYRVAEKEAVHKRNTSLSGPAIRTNTTPGNRLLNSGKQLPMQSSFTNDLSRLNSFYSPFHSFRFFNKDTVYPPFSFAPSFSFMSSPTPTRTSTPAPSSPSPPLTPPSPSSFESLFAYALWITYPEYLAYIKRVLPTVASRFLDRFCSLRHTTWFFHHYSGLLFTYRDNALLQAYIENPESFDYFHYTYPLPQLALHYHINQDHSIFDNLLSRPSLHPTIQELKELCNIQTISELLHVQYRLRATLDEANDYLASVGPLQGHGDLEGIPTFAFIYPRFQHS